MSLNLQQMILTLQDYWSKQGCVILQPYDMAVGAGTFHWATALRSLGNKPWKAAYVQACRRPKDGRYGQNPNRLQHYYQYQVLLKPSPVDSQELYLGSLEAIGIDIKKHDIRFVEDDWESPTLGAAGLGWEIWCNGMEVSQFTYFQQVCGFQCKPVSTELTYGLERLAMYVQGVDNVYDLRFNDEYKYGDVFQSAEVQYSHYNFKNADTKKLFSRFKEFEEECFEVLEQSEPMPLPAYDLCLQANHVFNLLDARKAISVADRQAYIGRVRAMAKKCGEAFLKSEGELNE